MNPLAEHIDATILKPTASIADVEAFIQTALEYECRAVCLSPNKLPLLVEYADRIKPCTVMSFPHGNDPLQVKRFALDCSIVAGAQEVDMVANLSALADNQWDEFSNEMKDLASEGRNKYLKVIIETCHLSNEQIARASKIVADHGIAFVKTSTGFAEGGATLEAVEIMAKAVQGTSTQVKAAGGIKTPAAAQQMLDAGASVIGSSDPATLLI